MKFWPRLEALAGYRLAVLGYGREGASVVQALRSRYRHADITVWAESGSLPDAEPSFTGPFDQRLCQFDIAVRSPGIPVDHPALRAFRDQGGRIVNPSSIWLAERADLTVVGVTGSKGKSTTAALLAHLLESCGRRVLLGGNIGVPLLDHLDTNAEIAVVELSSYQLADLEGRIDLGVITRLFGEHLDWHGSPEAYFAAKLRLAKLLDGRPLIINANDPELEAATAGTDHRIEGNRPPLVHRVGDSLMLGERVLASSDQLALVGRHNLDNAALACQAGMELGLDARDMAGPLASFRPLRHRLETVVDERDVRWINDSISSTPHSTLAALQSLQGHPVVLIVGGKARPVEWKPVIDWCQTHPLAALIGLPDNGPDVLGQFRQRLVPDRLPMMEAGDIGEAVAAADSLVGPGHVVLLSPGAPSFPHFRDFEDRGDQFAAAARSLTPDP